jgi:hypothetical protein
MLLFFDSLPVSPSAKAHNSTIRVFRGSKRIATVTRGVIHPKRRLTQEENAGIRTFVVTSVHDALQDYPAIQKLFGIKTTCF